MTRVKICGITSLDDALAAIDAGADALGFVFYEKSPRNVNPMQASAIIAKLPPFVQTVGLFVNEEAERVNWTADFCGLDVIQLHGDEEPDYCPEIRRRVIKAFRVKDAASLISLRRYSVAGCLLDAWSPAAPGGTGETFNWDLAREAAACGRLILAGGLTPDNVRRAVEQVRPYAVDVSSGVEAAPGKKDRDKVREFIRRAKGL
ncbi:phosphoribosylanthranilate isomerase [Geobacter argillaceus]|uniref:N-(5'-phosphoribosyl)anthranilate isomerase n=1 Tax=Geobacter argillaceus TaxID=345631 RepID=A0A562WSI2_9BACT|nr:phosphoribosylanthranilate isomerase [Geobacter argillaceus]TWJ32717.1 phosphoribosylanthranilate isomerase [Geobacter argillaceus]